MHEVNDESDPHVSGDGPLIELTNEHTFCNRDKVTIWDVACLVALVELK